MVFNVYEQLIIVFSAALTVVWTAYNCQFSPIRAMSCVANLISNSATIMIAILAITTFYSQDNNNINAMGLYDSFQNGIGDINLNNLAFNGTISNLYERLNIENFEFLDADNLIIEANNQKLNAHIPKVNKDIFKAKIFLKRILQNPYFETNLDGSKCLTINSTPIIFGLENSKQKVCLTPYGLNFFQIRDLEREINIEFIKSQIRKIVQEENILSYFENDNVIKFWGALAVNFYGKLLENLKKLNDEKRIEFDIEENGEKVLTFSIF